MKKMLLLLFTIVFSTTFIMSGVQICADAEEQDDILELYVSKAGDDKNDGSINSPFRTLEAARDAVQQLHNKTRGVIINIREGVYNFEDSFKIQDVDSGVKEDFPIIYRAYQNENVIFSGGVDIPVENFENITEQNVLDRLGESVKNKVLVTNLSDVGITAYNEISKLGFGWDMNVYPPMLTIDGESQTIARWPNNNNFAKTGQVITQGFIPRNYEPDKLEPGQVAPPREEWINQDGPEFEIKVDDTRANLWLEENDPWFYGYWVFDWAFDTFGVTKDQENNIRGITKRDNKWFVKASSPSRYGVASNKRYYAFNMLCEIDQPGEWFLDTLNGNLYLMPPTEGLNNKEIFLAILNKPYFDIVGAKNVIIENINFSNSLGNGISIKNSTNIKIYNCHFNDLSGKAVDIKGGNNCGVEKCKIERMGTGGISLIGGDRISLDRGNHYAVNNDISDFSTIVRTYTPAVQLTGVGNRATNNLIYDAPHMAIQFSGNDMLIENNEIFNVCYETDDAGAIYALRDWTQRGNIINNNYLHDIKGIGGNNGVAGVYLDDCFGSASITNNLFRNVNGYVILLGGGRDNLVKNNIILNDGFATGLHCDDRGLGWANKQTKGPNGSIYISYKEIYDELQKTENRLNKDKWEQKYPLLLKSAPKINDANIIIDQNGEQMGCPTGNQFIGNIMVGVSRDNDVTFNALSRGKYEHNYSYPRNTDIGFTDPNNDDYTFSDKSKITKLISDFQGIDITKVGLCN